MQPKTWNQQIVKENNKALVLQMILAKEPLSRADIAQVTGLNKATVSSMVNELLDEELIYESGPGESSGGRRPVLLHFNKVAGYAIGLNIGVNYILCILTDLKGNILIEKNQLLLDTSYPVVTSLVIEMIHSVMDEMPKSKYGTVGIGIGVPGIVDKSGTILLAPNLGWKDLSLKQLITDEFNLPVIIENEANAGSYGEKQFGVGQNFQNIVYVSAGIGIGVGIILNGELYQGKNGFAGEMGHMIIEANGKPCSCGSRGCWEAYASEHALINVENQKYLSLELLIELAEKNDQSALNLFEQIGRYLGYGINNIINTFNPEQVIIGNRLAKAQKWLEESIRKTINTHTLSFHRQEVELQFSTLSIYSAALGVIAFVVEDFITGGKVEEISN
ncbi:ROK family transcriptional regulator [Neobacillus sp. MM2021_6]|uniref:ROK family transcriptional regulator n=1 Tax=Bacillaceae TaxID=186817 RepID=UPI00140CE80F|nr:MULTISPECIES: ROK family transcriptional regulator [Bacillaceae]MBO0958706.1 ROK family transcriptional regulator [Neobacillus sp. MM2021_6]NHC18199.1 ROK family protein [Bacillus sp. MM2020_4]